MNANDSNNTSRTNWAALEAMTDEDIDFSDIPPLTDEFFENATLRIPAKQTPAKQTHNLVQLEPEVMRWFRARGGSDYQTLINSALQRYIAENSSQKASSAVEESI